MFFARSSQAAALITFVMAFSGCRIGNYQKDAPGPGDIAGYYEMLINPTITMCATLPNNQGGTGTITKCPFEAAVHLDPLISYIFTNPVDLIYNSSNGTLSFSPNPEAVSGTPIFTLPVLTDNNGNLGYAGPIAAFTPMLNHPNCQIDLSVGESGSYSSSGPFNSGTDLPVKGRVSLSLTWAYAISGSDCSLLASCYNGSNDSHGHPVCSTQDQAQVKMFFQSFLDTSILAVSDLSTVSALQYQVFYQ